MNNEKRFKTKIFYTKEDISSSSDTNEYSNEEGISEFMLMYLEYQSKKLNDCDLSEEEGEFYLKEELISALE